jgi:AcrR family transcriptional regulator
MPRKYQQKKRADHQEQTRQQIIVAAVEIIEQVGPTRVTISAIAERAGVERATVYRHFPDEQALFIGCMSHYIAAHPLPDPTRWQQISEPETRLRIGLTEIYAYHHQTEQMAAQTMRDLPDLPVLQEALRPYFQHWTRIRDVLGANWNTEGEQFRLLSAAIGHAIAFQTWHSLVQEQGLGNVQAIELMVALIRDVLTLLV